MSELEAAGALKKCSQKYRECGVRAESFLVRLARTHAPVSTGVWIQDLLIGSSENNCIEACARAVVLSLAAANATAAVFAGDFTVDFVLVVVTAAVGPELLGGVMYSNPPSSVALFWHNTKSAAVTYPSRL